MILGRLEIQLLMRFLGDSRCNLRGDIGQKGDAMTVEGCLF
jgi:hypothetical protein